MTTIPALMPQDIRIKVEVTPRQSVMIQHPATLLWIGTGTKTGKTTGLVLWQAEGLLAGDTCAWCGPWAARTRMAYEQLKRMLEYPIKLGVVKCNDTTMRISSTSGGSWDPYTGDNPDAIYGGSYKRFVIDEATRQKEETLTAALTVIAAVKGKIRLAFNLDKGGKNWAVRGLTRVRGLAPSERREQSEDFMMFPTLDEGFVTPEFVAKMRTKMSRQMYEALFLAVIPESDVSLFRDLSDFFCAPTFSEPLKGHSYCMGLDLARKHDWTVALVMDTLNGRVAAIDRFHEISWALQYNRAMALYRQWNCSAAFVDATGIGDPITEELSRRGMRVEPIVFSAPTKHSLFEELVAAYDNHEISAPPTPDYDPMRHEMEVFEYVLDPHGRISYGAPTGEHDDCVIALALANRGRRGGTAGAVLFGRGDTSRVTPKMFHSY